MEPRLFGELPRGEAWHISQAFRDHTDDHLQSKSGQPRYFSDLVQSALHAIRLTTTNLSEKALGFVPGQFLTRLRRSQQHATSAV